MMKIILVFYVAVIVAMFLITIKDFDNVALTPMELSEINNFDMFTATVLYMIMFVINPLFFISHFIFWVFDKGR